MKTTTNTVTRAKTKGRRVLILGGTGEARSLATCLAGHPDLQVVTSLAGATSRPVRPPGEVRLGGFGGTAGLAEYLRETQVDRVIDATHPFAAVISAHAVVACAEAEVPLLRLERPAWQALKGDNWIATADTQGAAIALKGLSDRVFLTVGRKELAAFAGLEDIWFLVRFIEPARERLPLAHCEVLIGRPPFSLDAEVALMRARRIGALVSKNSGGKATYTKIEAARRLGLPVVMIGRPWLPAAETAWDLATAVAWAGAP